MLRRAWLIWLFTAYTTACVAQLQNSNWCFGQLAGFRFTPSGSVAYKTAIFSEENCATVSHRRTGKLLFYTDGRLVYDTMHYVMPNGVGIGTDVTGTSAQGSLIIPFPLDTNKYYIFTMAHLGDTQSYLRYSVVDMSLNGGMGDVVSGEKGIIIDSNLTEAMTSINACSQTWLVTIKKNTNEFNLIRITPSGIDGNRVISQKAYTRGSNGLTMVKLARNTKKLAVTTWNGTGKISYLALHDFDVSTGNVSGGAIIDSVIGKDEFYGCEFSFDSKKLFATAHSSRKLYQYDLNQTTPSTILASRQTVFSASVDIGAPQAGPDNNIYIASFGQKYLSCVSSPHIMFPGCTFTLQAIALANTTAGLFNLPQAIRFLDEKSFIAGNTHDTVVCSTPLYKIQAPIGHEKYQWQDSSTNNYLMVAASGMYTVKITDSCFDYIDTFHVLIKPTLYAAIGNDTAICEDIAIQLSNRQNTIGTAYWSTGSTAPAITVSQPGTYWLRITNDGCSVYDTITITRRPPPNVFIGNDTSVCQHTKMVLYCNVQPLGSRYLWSTGDTTEFISITDTGTYSLRVRDDDCVATDSVHISLIPQPQIWLGNDSSICVGKSLFLPRGIVKGIDYRFWWMDGSSDSSKDVNTAGMYAVTLQNRCGTVSDTVYVDFKNCHIWFPSAFSPNGDGMNDIAHLVGDIAGVTAFRIIIYNRWGQQVYNSINPRDGWDGTLNGKPAETGVYYYMIRIGYKEWNGLKEQTWKGDITLVR
ncbi:hypothetical protein CAP35_05775 [Chitinophagaceae bacterium IBVUCB1]|nr:hypothetical protein CAP35_05775 [Chitinophagaceae bacterium IBVUCB1]